MFEVNQQLFNILLAVAAFFGGYSMKSITDDIKQLWAEHFKVKEEVSQLKVLVAGNYVTQEMFQKTTDAIFKKLDRIEELGARGRQ